jgi:putative FmdB family regulatory protein
MPVYAYACPACEALSEARRPVEQRNEPVPCTVCGADAFRRFDPRAVMIQTPESLRYVKGDFMPLSTPEHSSSYLQGALIEQASRQFAEHWEKQAARKTVKDRLLETMPAGELDKPFTRQDREEVSRLLAAGPPGATHAS